MAAFAHSAARRAVVAWIAVGALCATGVGCGFRGSVDDSPASRAPDDGGVAAAASVAMVRFDRGQAALSPAAIPHGTVPGHPISGPTPDLCPGDPYDLYLDTPIAIDGDTTGLTGDHNYCAGQSGPSDPSGPDAVYAFTAKASGTVRFNVLNAPPGFTWALTAQTDCADTTSASLVGCTFVWSGSALSFAATANTTYYVFVDGVFQSSGAYRSGRMIAPKALVS